MTATKYPIVERLRRCADERSIPFFTEMRETADIIETLAEALELGVRLKGGWREAIVELEDYCSERVRLRNMIAAADQLDDWGSRARVALAKLKGEA